MRAFGSAITSPSRVTSNTDRNSMEEPVSPGSFSIEMTCPGATRYCLPPVAMTASITQTFLNRLE